MLVNTPVVANTSIVMMVHTFISHSLYHLEPYLGDEKEMLLAPLTKGAKTFLCKVATREPNLQTQTCAGK